MGHPRVEAEGFLEEVGNMVTGWAWIPSAPGRRLRVAILFDDGRLGSLVRVEVEADRHRADLEAAGKGDGRYGFAVAVPEAFAGREHVVDVRLQDLPEARLPGAPRRAVFTLGPVTLRAARPLDQDVARLCALLADLVQLNGGSATAAFDAAGIRAWLAASDRCWLIAERAGRVVGHCRLGPDWPAEPGSESLALGIELHPDVRDFGLGRALILAAHRWAAGRCTRIELAVLPHNARALHLYRSLGYADLGPVRLPGTGELHRRMAVRLPPHRRSEGVFLVV